MAANFKSVFDQNDSGNISFGVMDKDEKYFIKIAGAKTAESCSDTKNAVKALRNAIPIYEDLNHANLIHLMEHFEEEDLYVAVFHWAEGDCLFDYWNFETYAKNSLIKSPFQRYKQLALDLRIKSIHTIFEFLIHMEEKGYVAIDFYDGSILYDFTDNRTTICDIDFFRKKPTYNDMGDKFWGTKRLKAPEEYVLGAIIDERTNVFTLGALILHFFGNYEKVDIEKMYEDNCFYPCEINTWELNSKMYEVVLKAVKKEREERYSSLKEFFYAWKEAETTVE
ncbi:MAG: hypothetical protein K0S47_1396 [Herbinix sp.]|nr:hypothetical protein [Herbinix sp.]